MKKKSNTAVRYDEATCKKIASFLRTNSNQAAKKQFGCSAHWAARLRQTHKIPDYVSPKAAPKAARKTSGKKPAAKRKVSKKAAALL